MIADKFRLFKGSTELSYTECITSETNNREINSGSAVIKGNSVVVNGSLIDVKRADGTTTVFSANVINITKDRTWKLKLMTKGYELMNIPIEQVYEKRSPEYIVQDIVDTYSINLTYASTTSSGITIPKYVARGQYAMDIIKEMIDTLKWQLRIDESGNVYFEPSGNIDNEVTLTNGTNFKVTKWTEDNTYMFNRVKVKGDLINHYTDQTFTGDGVTTEFILGKKPVGSVKVTDNGTEVVPTVQSSPYTVSPDQRKITFSTAPANGHTIIIYYTFHIPVVVDYQNDESIDTYGEIFKEIQAPYIDSFSAARTYAQNLLLVYSTPSHKASGYEPGLNFDKSVGEYVTVVDAIRDKNERLIITRISRDAKKARTSYNFGTKAFVFNDWQAEVQERIKKLERRLVDESEPAFCRLFEHDLDVELTLTKTCELIYPVDSFVLGHQTLSRLRPNLNFEADCSDQTHHGTWVGTGIDGSQYVTNGWRLSGGEFNGSDRKITVTDHTDLDCDNDFSIAFAIRVDSLPGSETYILNKWDGTDGYAVRITATNKIELIYSNSGSDSTITTDAALTANTYYYIVFVKDGTDLEVYIDGSSDNTDTGDAVAGTNNNDLIVGNYSASWLTGFLDEVRIYDEALSASEVLTLYVYKEELTLTDCKLWLSMDNPRLGDRFTEKVNCSVVTSNTFTEVFDDTDFKDATTTADWDTTNERLTLTDDTSKRKAYVTMGLSAECMFGGKSFATATLTATESLWGSDTVRYFMSANGKTNWEECTNGTAHTFTNIGNQLYWMAILIGNGSVDTYVEDITIVATRV